jgi:hypothetical protein
MVKGSVTTPIKTNITINGVDMTILSGDGKSAQHVRSQDDDV